MKSGLMRSIVTAPLRPRPNGECMEAWERRPAGPKARRSDLYKTIYLPVDNSDLSNCAVHLGVLIGQTVGARVIGSHVYAARMHERRFKQMEAGLPEEYHDEKELERQRGIHDSLILRGLQVISDSYLDQVARRCGEANLSFEGRALEGKNYKALMEDIESNRYDLVVMGASGIGAVHDRALGSVCERLVRRVRSSDVLVVKHTKPILDGKILVALDGSPHAFGGLRTAVTLGQMLGRPVEVVAAFDPYFHYAAFHSIGSVLSEQAGKVFRFKEQEKLHEEIIDSGLAKIYQAQLDIARAIAREMGSDIAVTLLDGKAPDKVLRRVNQTRPWLLVVGRIGIHGDEELDIGSNAEQLLRESPCHVLISNRTYTPPSETAAEHTVAWSHEAVVRMGSAGMPPCAKLAITQYALEQGHTVITCSVIEAALKHWMPGAHGPGAQTDPQGTARLIYRCEGCGYVAKEAPPRVCPVCRAAGERCTPTDLSAFETGRASEGRVTLEVAFDGVGLEWTESARAALDRIPSGVARRRVRAQVEKSARRLGLRVITEAFILPFATHEDGITP
jgi:nucleotide-binding universal stress UspA family protein